MNRVKEGTGVVISISENDGSNVIRIEGNLAGVLKAQTVCITFTSTSKNCFNKRERNTLMLLSYK